MPNKPQQQTLSVRITDSMRRRLERARQLAASKTGEAISTSEIAKQFLESARDDRLELVDLLAAPTETLLGIRRKGEAGVVLSRAEWTVLAHFAQVGVESTALHTPSPVSAASLATLLDAFLAVFAVRTNDEAGLDGYYLGNLPAECRSRASKRGGQATADAVRRSVLATRQRVMEPADPLRPLGVSRNLYVLLESERLPGAEDLNRALRPFWGPLWRLAARGHFVRTQTPVRDPAADREGLYQPPVPSLTEEGFALHFARGAGTEFSMLLGFPAARVLYPIAGFPRLSEFSSMVAALHANPTEPGWAGAFFIGGVIADVDGAPAVWFRAHDNGITVQCSATEWAAVQRLFRRAWELPDIRRAWEALTMEYGEL